MVTIICYSSQKRAIHQEGDFAPFEISIGGFYVKTDANPDGSSGVAGDYFFVVENRGSKRFSQGLGVHYSQIVVKNGDGGSAETFASASALMNRLKTLNYPGFNDGSGGGSGAVDSVNGMTGAVVVDGSNIDVTDPTTESTGTLNDALDNIYEAVGSSGVQSVTGTSVDDTDPTNPVVNAIPTSGMGAFFGFQNDEPAAAAAFQFGDNGEFGGEEGRFIIINGYDKIISFYNLAKDYANQISYIDEAGATFQDPLNGRVVGIGVDNGEGEPYFGFTNTNGKTAQISSLGLTEDSYVRPPSGVGTPTSPEIVVTSISVNEGTRLKADDDGNVDLTISGGGGGISSITGSDGIEVDDTDPDNPALSLGDITPDSVVASTYGTAEVTDTELGYLDGATSNIQDQLDILASGYLIVRKSLNGTETGYNPTEDTDTARGVALQEAKSDAEEGDVIYVGGGIYDTYDLAKNGLTYYFYPNATVQYIGDDDGVKIFSDNDTEMNFKVYGYGEFINNGSSVVKGNGVMILNPESNWVLYGRKISNSNGVALKLTEGRLYAEFDEIESTDGAVDMDNGDDGTGFVTVRARSIRSYESFAIEHDGGIMDIRADKIESLGSNATVTTLVGEGSLRIQANEIISDDSANVTFELSSDRTSVQVVGADIKSGTSVDDVYIANGATVIFESITSKGTDNITYQSGSQKAVFVGNPQTLQQVLNVGDTATGDLTLVGNLKATTYGTAAVTDTELGYVDGVTSNIQTQLNGKIKANIRVQGASIPNLQDNTTYHFAGSNNVAPTTSSRYSISAPVTSSLVRVNAFLYYTGSSGSAEDISVVLYNLTTSTAYTIGNIKANQFSNLLLATTAVSVTAGDEIEMRYVVPNMATNPAGVLVGADIDFF